MNQFVKLFGLYLFKDKHSMETQSTISLKNVNENILDDKQGTQAQKEISKEEGYEDHFEIRSKFNNINQIT